MSILGLDIGGANIKTAHTDGGVRSIPFALWRSPYNLRQVLRNILDDSPPFDRVACTMTGELCDCFATKRVGVGAILEAMIGACGNVPLTVWTTDGRFVSTDIARVNPLACAAANWHALATWVASAYPDRPGLLIDTGSTTTDIIPFADGYVTAKGKTDTQRLAEGELVYLGAARTPLMALGTDIEFKGKTHGVMAEYFATMADVMVLLGHRPDDPGDLDTGDGRPMTGPFAAARVLRMVGGDCEIFTSDDARGLATNFYRMAVERLVPFIQILRPSFVIVSGSGERLASDAVERALPGCGVQRLSDRVGLPASSCACAWALVQLGAKGHV